MVFFTLLAVGCDHTFAPVAASKATTAERPAKLLSIVATNTFPCATMGEVMKMFPPALAVQRSCRARTGWSVPIVSLCISLPRSCAHCPETFTEGRVPKAKRRSRVRLVPSEQVAVTLRVSVSPCGALDRSTSVL